MLTKNLILSITGLSGGFIVGGGVFAFITMIGIFPRLADRTNTASHIKGYEDAIVLGGTLGNLITVFSPRIPLGMGLIILFGIFSGIYVGCLAMALAEVLRVMPIFVNRVKIKYGMAFIIFAAALGKGLGSLYELWK